MCECGVDVNNLVVTTCTGEKRACTINFCNVNLFTGFSAPTYMYVHVQKLSLFLYS